MPLPDFIPGIEGLYSLDTSNPFKPLSILTWSYFVSDFNNHFPRFNVLGGCPLKSLKCRTFTCWLPFWHRTSSVGGWKTTLHLCEKWGSKPGHRNWTVISTQCPVILTTSDNYCWWQCKTTELTLRLLRYRREWTTNRASLLTSRGSTIVSRRTISLASKYIITDNKTNEVLLHITYVHRTVTCIASMLAVLKSTLQHNS